ncbi:MAG: alpha/beta hydrolase [Myxococcales bacterium]|nr:alpha/beta hydrolase [Myxococcales bacterium]USN51292.1 MAG: alpha/beta hydrolase [Myxococcales bacterium]
MTTVKIAKETQLAYLRVGKHHHENSAIFLHGIMGNKKNWQSFLRLFIEACPKWDALVFDLRNHGESSKHQEPFTVHATAFDIAQACDLLQIRPKAIIGHSFGAKVATLAADMMSSSVEQLWLLDSSLSMISSPNPLGSPNDTTALGLLELLDRIKWPLTSRRALIEELLTRGVNEQIALWMTTNLIVAEDGFRLNFEPSELKAMLINFLELDLWNRVPQLSQRMDIHMLSAQHGYRLFEHDQIRLKELAGMQGYFHLLRDSGHFVQADNPRGLLEILQPYFNQVI